MSFLQITIFNNTLQECLLAIAILGASFVFARFFGIYLQKRIVPHIFQQGKIVSREQLSRIALVISLFIPLVGSNLAYDQLYLPQEIERIVHGLLLFIAQILLFALLYYTTIPSLRSWASTDYSDISNTSKGLSEKFKKEEIRLKNNILHSVRTMIFLSMAITIPISLGVLNSYYWLVLLPGVGLICSINIKRLFDIYRIPQLENDKVTVERKNAGIEISNNNISDLQIRSSIIKLFLKIYTIQLGAELDCKKEVSIVEEYSTRGEYVYDLRVKKDISWKSRRMTVGRLSEDILSRSKCFYVIYDDYLVIKIPPVPITDIKQYVNILKKENDIAVKLDLKGCIIPSVSVILQYVHASFRKESKLNKDTDTRRLLALPQLHKFLKIGDTFAFFMDLTRHYFLRDAIDTIHGSKKRLRKKIAIDPQKLSSSHNNQSNQEKLLKATMSILYTDYQLRINKIQFEDKDFLVSSAPSIKKLFYMNLAGYRNVDLLTDIPDPVAKKVKDIIAEIIVRQKPLVTRYRNTLEEVVYAKIFFRNNTRMGGIISNLIELIALLWKKNIAIRDLKPDNLFISSDSSWYPGFLAQPEKYDIGLIDLDTAIHHNPLNKRNILQPQLGGTNKYVTPSHFFDNTTLIKLYGGIYDLFHLQDWYAMIAMSYGVVVGEFLFENTSYLVPIVVKRIRKAFLNEQLLYDIGPELSTFFWRQAKSEFATKMDQKKDYLMGVEVILTKDVQEMLTYFIATEYTEIIERLDMFISTNENFTESNKRNACLLPQANKSIDIVCKRFQNMAIAQDKKINIKVKDLEDFRNLSAVADDHKRLLELLTGPTDKIPAYNLLKSMFGVVHRGMYNEEWGYRVNDSPTCQDNNSKVKLDKTDVLLKNKQEGFIANPATHPA
jgi:hypothetical protein